MTVAAMRNLRSYPCVIRVGEYEAEEIELTEVEALNEEEDDQYRWKVQLTSLKNGQSRSGIFQTAVKMLTLLVREQFYFDAKYNVCHSS